ncbi:DUF1287 domain-containing protein [Flavobacterium sp.]|jgi:uncharacterized protein YijF (DUF1287 family)|uniref:DUF1287 domain-containing protein n=1 Tax=Flavobacterium sp. TaxID=239 RepID=UPI0037BFC2D6
MKLLTVFLFICFSFGCKENEIVSKPKASIIEKPSTFEEKLANAAISIVDPTVVYTPDYVSLKYPNGDVPAKTGVCSDVVIRSYRKLNIDLQKEVHEDMKVNFSRYPKKWGLKFCDTNIDHRRVPNLEVFFTRKGEKLEVSDNPKDYKAGEIVTWIIGEKLPHIGIVTHKKSADGKRSLVVHNIGSGQVLEDCLFNYRIVGHFKYIK